MQDRIRNHVKRYIATERAALWPLMAEIDGPYADFSCGRTA